MRKVLEGKVERYLVKRLARIGLDCKKFIPDYDNGMPDRVILLPDRRVIWVELKTDGGVLSDLQKYCHARLKASGHDVRVVWNKEQADNLIEELANDQIKQRE
jgi:hypothetical protein